MGSQQVQVMDPILKIKNMQMLNFGLLSGWNCSIHCEVKLTSRASGGLSTGTEEVLVLEEDYVGLLYRKA